MASQPTPPNVPPSRNKTIGFPYQIFLELQSQAVLNGWTYSFLAIFYVERFGIIIQVIAKHLFQWMASSRYSWHWLVLWDPEDMLWYFAQLEPMLLEDNCWKNHLTLSLGESPKAGIVYQTTVTIGYNHSLGGGFQRSFIFTPIPGEMIQFDSYFFKWAGLKPRTSSLSL